jgi:hypothetical protein
MTVRIMKSRRRQHGQHTAPGVEWRGPLRLAAPARRLAEAGALVPDRLLPPTTSNLSRTTALHPFPSKQLQSIMASPSQLVSRLSSRLSLSDETLYRLTAYLGTLSGTECVSPSSA